MIARRGAPFGGNPFGVLILLILLLAVVQGNVAGPLNGVIRDPTSLDAWIAFSGFVIAIALGIAVHEFMHAYTAHRMGDDTARHMGRLTLDPRAHLDLWGSLLIVLIGFGYGKPVPVSEGRLRSPAAYALVAAAGPLTNVVLAAVAALPLRTGTAGVLGAAYADILGTIVIINCLLAVFNLVPIPPLDGSKVVYGLLPPRQAYAWRTYEQYGPFVLIAVIFLLPYLRIDFLGPVVIGPARALAGLLVGQGF
ncbi:MAG: site-2 protease family protein [Candidatus Limnocylindria bacterium]